MANISHYIRHNTLTKEQKYAILSVRKFTRAQVERGHHPKTKESSMKSVIKIFVPVTAPLIQIVRVAVPVAGGAGLFFLLVFLGMLLKGNDVLKIMKYEWSQTDHYYERVAKQNHT